MSDRLHRRTLGPQFSEGARLVWIWLAEDTERSMADLARASGVPVTVLHRGLYGDRMPTAASLVKLEAATGVPVAAWMKPPTVAFLPPGADPDAFDGPTLKTPLSDIPTGVSSPSAQAANPAAPTAKGAQ